MGEIVSHADRLLEWARRRWGELLTHSEERRRIVAAAEMLGQLLPQDSEDRDAGVGLGDGVAKTGLRQRINRRSTAGIRR